MPDFSLISGGDHESQGGRTTLTADASTNTKGAWAQLIAATTIHAAGLVVFVRGGSAAGKYLMDIAVGGAGSETVILPNVHHSSASGSNIGGSSYVFALSIPAGSRIAARCQSTTGGATLIVSVVLIGTTLAGRQPLGEAAVYGADTSDSGLIAVDPGATANTKGSWVELTASTTRPIRELVVALFHDGTFSSVGIVWKVDIGIGAAAAEAVVIPNLETYMTTSERLPMIQSYTIPVNVPAGARLAARAEATSNSSPSRLIDVAVYALS